MIIYNFTVLRECRMFAEQCFLKIFHDFPFNLNNQHLKCFRRYSRLFERERSDKNLNLALNWAVGEAASLKKMVNHPPSWIYHITFEETNCS